ncbi:MAG TPA: hypothetical protein EYP03_02465 [Aquificae bacterium]|nr:hypothetical protein [Aquificota bacterium]
MVAFIFKVINFILFILVLYKLLKRPILKFLEKEKEIILKKKEELELEKSRLEEAIKKLDIKIANAEKEAELIIKLAEQKAKKKREEILKEAKKIIEQYKDSVEKKIEEEIYTLKFQLKKLAINEAIREAEKILKNKLTQREDEEFIKESLRRLQVGRK